MANRAMIAKLEGVEAQLKKVEEGYERTVHSPEGTQLHDNALMQARREVWDLNTMLVSLKNDCLTLDPPLNPLKGER